MQEKIADICILAEGSYPYYAGGVASWVHQLIKEHKERTFYVYTLMPPNPVLIQHYEFPKNVIGHTVHIMQDLADGDRPYNTPPETWEIIGHTLKELVTKKNFTDLEPMLSLCRKYKKVLGKRILCESKESWNFILALYKEVIPEGPFKDYFSTIMVLMRSLLSIFLNDFPKARLYHALCTGYAGLLLYRAKHEIGAPCVLTEQGIYTNERRIEVAMADWIGEVGSQNLALEDKKRSLKDFWLNAFFSFANSCYTACDKIISTFDGNQEAQIEAGADPRKLRTIVHGIRPEEYLSLKVKKERVRRVAFVGRIVPIKDVKTFIRACHIVKQILPDIEFLAVGPLDEDPDYYQECQRLIDTLGLENAILFTGKVDMREYFPTIDLIVLTSLSEAQPLVILEAGFLGIPFIATNVGACKQLCFGQEGEDPWCGQGGIITSLVNPQDTAHAIIKMVNDEAFYKKCGQAMEKRIASHYNFSAQHDEYRKYYNQFLKSG